MKGEVDSKRAQKSAQEAQEVRREWLTFQC